MPRAFTSDTLSAGIDMACIGHVVEPVDHGHDRNNIEGGSGGYWSADKAEANALWAPY